MAEVVASAGARGRGDAARRGRALQARLRRVRPGHGRGHLVPRRAQAAAAGDGAVPALPRGDRADVGVGARRGGGGLLLRARRRPARAPPRRLGRRRARPRGRVQGHAARAARAGAARRARLARPACSPASCRRSSSRTCHTSSPEGPSARCSRAARAGPAGRSSSPSSRGSPRPTLARWLALALFVGGALWIAGSFRGREKTAEAFAWTLTLLILCLPVVHAWYWLTPLALGLAAGLWLPLLIAMVAPLVESLPLAAKLARLRGELGAVVVGRAGVGRHARRFLGP